MSGQVAGIPIGYIQGVLSNNMEEADNIQVVEDYAGNKYALDLKYLTHKQGIVWDNIDDETTWTHVVFEETQSAPNPVREPVLAIYELGGKYFFTRAVRVKGTSKYYIPKPQNANLIGILGYYMEFNPDGTPKMMWPVLYVNETLSDWIYFPLLEITFDNGMKLYLYCNTQFWVIGAVTGIVGLALLGWAVDQITAYTIESKKTESELIRARNEQTKVNLAQQIYNQVINDKTLSPEEKMKILQQVLQILTGVSYTNYAVSNPPSTTEDNTNDKYKDKQSSWIDQLLGWIKDNWIILPTLIGMIIFIWKFKLIKEIFSSLIESIRGRVRR